MRQKRAKAYERLMTAYERYFRYRQPYQILIDDAFALNLHRAQLSPQKQCDMVMRSETKIMITQCTMQALYARGPECQPAVDLAKSFERLHECIKSVVGDTNKHRYVIATTNTELRKHLHSIPGIPILHYNRMVIVLEPPSDATSNRIKQIEGEKVSQSVVEKKVLDGQAKEEAGENPREENSEQPKKKKRKGPKGPNPLAAKKKKPEKSKPQKHDTDKDDKDAPKKKRSRRRNKIGGDSDSADTPTPATA
ncbi:hypothetical protein E3P86_01200 [Wallemia ichthyophaga]|uniref:UTP23 sensor motif region domain-containing protein n=1 Tax=Wallemia ichthyophaga TaxID=245174 RepID=A0A4T0JAI5_WALIC|nr:hypothetical protein E3P86_01200 [Wallemia ichthyophaga]